MNKIFSIFLIVMIYLASSCRQSESKQIISLSSAKEKDTAKENKQILIEKPATVKEINSKNIYCSENCDTMYSSHNPLRICYKSFWGNIEEDTLYIRSKIFPMNKLISEGVEIKSSPAHEGSHSGEFSFKQEITIISAEPATFKRKYCRVEYNANTFISFTYNGNKQIGIAKGNGPIIWEPKGSRSFSKSFPESHTAIFR
jgi:hypothetical protein